MARAGFGAVARQMERLFGGGSVAGLDEGELLRRFASRRDPAALEALVSLHGPMVLGVCRRVLGSSHDAEDAFQATFLILVKKAGTIRDPAGLGPWLYGVAHRVAIRARGNAARRRARERPGAEESAMAATGDPSSLDRRELRSVLDDAIAALPERFRRPVILCYLEGLTHDQAADRLRCPVGTIRSRLATAREKLRAKLSRKGVTMPAAALATAIASEAAPAAVSAVLLERTITAATAFAVGGVAAATAGAVPAGAAALAEGMATTMMITKMKVVGGMLLAGVLTIGVGGAAAWQIRDGESGAPKTEQQGGEAKPFDALEDVRAIGAEMNKQIAELEAKRRVRETLDAETAELEASISELREKLRVAIRDMNFRPGGPLAKETKSDATPKAEAVGPGALGSGRAAPDPTVAGMRGGGAMGPGLGGGRGGLGGGGMMGGMPAKPSIARIESTNFLIVQKPGQNQLHAYDNETGAWSSYTVPEGVTVTPILSGAIAVLFPKGKEIRQLAAYVGKTSRWYPLDLETPIEGSAVPVVGHDLAAYAVGNRVFAFSGTAGKWGTIELEEGAKPLASVGTNRVTVEYKDHLYLFSAKTGEWSDFDAGTGQVVEPPSK